VTGNNLVLFIPVCLE